jgi:hypothetical protein
MNGKQAIKMVGVLWLALIWSTVAIKAQPMPPPDPNVELDSWSFDDTNWLSDLGYAPISFSNLSNPASFDGNALQVDSTNAAWLQYNIVESDGSNNLRFVEGAVEMWVSPDWDSGTGPGDFGRLIDVGAYSTNAPSSWWSLYFTPDGSRINFSSETNGVFTNYLSVPIAWSSNAWHFIALAYNPVRSQLYVDGQLATNGAGVFYRPSASVVSNGFFVGSDHTGLAQSRACIDDMATYSYAISDYEVTNDYAAGLQLINGGGFHTDSGSGIPGFGDTGTNNYSYNFTNSPPNYGTNLWIARVNIVSNILAGIVSNTVIDTEYEIQSLTNLTRTNWVSQGFIIGSAATNWTALNGLPVSPTNSFFIRVRSWADNGSGLPVWWQVQYFGTNGVDPYDDPMGDGYDNLYKFQNGMNPNVFYQPAAPKNFATFYNLTTSTETVTWSGSPGPVTSYTLTVNNYQNGQTTNITISATNTSFTMYLAAASPDFEYPPYGPQINVEYGLVANYGTNQSALAGSQFAENDPAPTAELINGSDGRLWYLASSAEFMGRFIWFREAA